MHQSISILWAVLWVVAGLCLLCAAINYAVDPAGLYRGPAKQPRNLRTRKAKLLRARHGEGKSGVKTLLLGSSRCFNLKLSEDNRFPQPVFNFAVTAARAEDWLAAWRICRQISPVAPRLLVICAELPALHPRLPCEWEALTAPEWSQLLDSCGAVKRGRSWRWIMLLSPLQLRRSLTELQRAWRSRKRGVSAGTKFVWAADGSGDWQDLIQGQRNPRLIARQLRTYPRNGIAIRGFSEPSQARLHMLATLLSEARQSGTPTIVYLAPEHPRMMARLGAAGQRVLAQCSSALRIICLEHGAHFIDLADGQVLPLEDGDFRDALHLVGAAQERVRGHLAGIAASKPSR